ncbi:MAG: membrane-bound lytic murein transglycosylase C [Bacteroidia bacterium]|jgi:membrane-bound lytic murein transglycosylase C
MQILLTYSAFARLLCFFQTRVYRVLLIGWLYSSTTLLAEQLPDFNGYSPDVAALLEEYHGESDGQGSMSPAILSYHGVSDAETLIDFERGIITISATDAKGVKQAAVEILLTQIDPAVIDARTAHDLGLVNSKTQKPFFYEQVVDQDGVAIASLWRAGRFVDYLIGRQAHINTSRLVIPMIGEHKAIAGNKYLAFAKAASAKHRIRVPLIMAIIETESAFNPLARSRSNALGLMQIKADTAGRDYFSIIGGYNHTPTKAFLYDPANNIEVGTGYLSILADRYLAGIYHPQKLEYAIISSYNGGSGNLFKSLAPSGNRQAAIDRVNAMTVKEFYWFLTHRHVRKESMHYVKKVTTLMAKYGRS